MIHLSYLFSLYCEPNKIFSFTVPLKSHGVYGTYTPSHICSNSIDFPEPTLPTMQVNFP